MEKNFKEKLEEQEIIKKIENSQTLEKGKQGVFSVLYGRTIVVFLLLLIQILIMIFGGDAAGRSLVCICSDHDGIGCNTGYLPY